MQSASKTLSGEFCTLVSHLEKVVGKGNVLYSNEDLALYECDAETLDLAAPDLVVLPGSTKQVKRVVEIAAAKGMPITPRGAGTGLSGGATTVMGGIALVLTRMNRILEIDPDSMVARVEAGATNISVSEAAAVHGLYFAPDPSSQIASTIGGNIAENAGGPHTLKYGMTCRHVLGATAVFSDGMVTQIGGRARQTSFDLTGAVVGSEGTLVVVTEAFLRLTPRAPSVETMIAYFASVGDGGQTVSDIVAHGVVPAAMEMIDRLTLNAVEDSFALGLDRTAAALLIVELDGPEAGIKVHRNIVEECARNNAVKELRWARDAKERLTLWKARKMSFGALGRIAPHGYVLDGVIPRSMLAVAIGKIEDIGRKHGLVVANVYHAGDGNLHPCILYHRDNEEEVIRTIQAGKEILELCVELGGTLSGEHGIGIEKVMEMPLVFNQQELDAMFDFRKSFDSAQILNPGKILPTPKSCGESGARPLLRHKLINVC